MKRLTFFFALLTMVIGAQAQDFTTIYGKVQDSKTDKPIVYASVAIEGSNISVITNSDGFFSLKVPSETPSDAQISVSYLGYATISNTLLEFQKSTADKPFLIPLTAQAILIQAATINSSDAKDIVNYAFSKVKDNYSNQYETMVGFYREMVIKGNNKYLSMIEAILDISKAPYQNVFSIDKAQIFKGRGSTDYSGKDSLFVQVQGGIASALSLDVAKDPFVGVYPVDMHQTYRFSLDGITQIDSKDYYIVSFNEKEPKPETPLYRGKLYIQTESYAIGRIDYYRNVEDNNNALKYFIKEYPKNSKIAVNEAHFTLDFKQAEDNLYHFNYCRMEVSFTSYRKISLFSTKYNVVSEMAVTDHYPEKTQIDNKSRVKLSDITSSTLESFTDENFWGSYNVIEPDKSIDVIINKIIKQLKRR